ncbi:MAG: aldehyde reductase [Lentisphaerae bacterium GWF2_44_16]|nr:MAG: aldehyde reductase [Lentisphaerae bacterium GWF2_44_16]
MLNFTFCNPVKIVFGKETIAELETLIPIEKYVMMVYGGGSIKKNGVYEQVKKALKHHDMVEFGGIEPNPLYETCMKAVEICRRDKIDFILAVGGGSVLDASKFIAASVDFDGEDPWEILVKGAEITSAIPIGSVMTLPATGSEMNSNSVISRKSTTEKFHFSSPLVYPQFSILDPETTYSLPERQTANGIVDAFVHVMEQYMTFDVNAPLQDRQAEAILLTLIEEAPKVKANPNDYNARANIMWCAAEALNGVISSGVPQDWATHMLGHELTAVYGLDHAQTLACVLPSLLRNRKNAKLGKLVQMGRRVFGINENDNEKGAEKTIGSIEDFFHSVGMKTKLSDYNIASGDAANKILERLSKRNAIYGEHEDITPDISAEIIKNC